MDSSLIIRIAEGDLGALDELYAKMHKNVRALAIYILKDPELAAGVGQDTFVKIWRNSGQYTPENDDEHWVIKIAKNTALNYYRSRRRDREIREQYAGEKTYEMLEQCIDEKSEVFRILTYQERTVIKMKLAGFKQKEIAARLSCPRDRINYLLRTAKKKFDEFFDKK